MQMVRLTPVTDLPRTLDPGEYLFRRKADGEPVLLLRIVEPTPSTEVADLIRHLKH